MKVRPILVPNIEIYLDRLYWQKAAAVGPLPIGRSNPFAKPQLTATHRFLGHRDPTASRMPVVVDQEIYAVALAPGELLEVFRKLPGQCVTNDQQGRTPSRYLPGERDACRTERTFLNDRPLCVVLGESVDGDFLNPDLPAFLV